MLTTIVNNLQSAAGPALALAVLAVILWAMRDTFR